MKFTAFKAKSNQWVVNEQYLLFGKTLIPFEQVYLYTFQHKDKPAYLLSFQYKPTVFMNAMWLEKDDLIEHLLAHQLIQKVEKEVVKIKYRTERSGFLGLADGTAISWSNVYDTGSYNVWFRFGDEEDEHVRKPVIQALSIGNKNFEKEDAELELKGRLDVLEGIIPLNPWEKNEAYWIQHFKINKNKTGLGCGQIFVVVIVFLVIVFFILSLLP